MTKRDILSDADVEVLFETKPISDIKQFNHELEKDIDKKREELRTTVGERYRDLMEAAETITHMKSTSVDVVNAFKDIAATTSKYEYYSGHSNNKYGRDNNFEEENQNVGDSFESTDLAAAAQIKLLMDSPEIMWSAVDTGDYLTAAQVFLFARHIHTNLTFNTNSVSGKRISSVFPIIERQWSSILPFYETILNGCTQLISDESISYDLEANSDEPDNVTIDTRNIVRSMAAMTLLKGIKTKDLFKEFLALREKTIKQIIFAEGHSAKIHIRNTTLSAIFCIQSCCAFLPVDDNAETIENVLHEISKKPALSLFQNISVSPIMKHLPSIIRDFHPSVVAEGHISSRSTKPDALDHDFLTSECTNWLDRVHGMITSGTSKVLTHVNTLSGLSMIRRNTYDFLAWINEKKKCASIQKDWNSVCMSILKRTVNIWDEFYRNLFRDRAEELISKEIQNAILYLQTSLTSVADVQNHDIAEFVWVEGNLNESILDQNETKNGKVKALSSLELKARSYPPAVQAICQKFDDVLQALLSQLSDYVANEQSTESKVPSETSSAENNIFVKSMKPNGNENKPFKLDQDNAAILKFVEDSISTSVSKMLEEINSLVNNELQCTDTTAVINERYVVMARICQAIPELSPSLENCCTASDYFRQENLQDLYINNDYLGELKNLSIKSSKLSNERHQKVKELNESFVNTCSLLLTTWTELIGTKMTNMLINGLTNNLEANLNMLPQWEAVEISEEGEDNKQIKSTIRIPNQISVVLFQVIHKYAHSIYAIGSHNLPLKVQEHVSHHTPIWISRAYSSIFATKNSSNEKQNVRITQNVALQLYFDVQFILQCMTSRDNKETSSFCQQVISNIEQHIDPFDLSVFSPYIATNVKRCVLKYQALYGILIPVDKYTLLTSMKAALPQAPMSSSMLQPGGIGGAGQSSECSIQLSNFSQRFPLLPIATKKPDNSRIGARESNRVSASVPKRNNDNSSERDSRSKTKNLEGAAYGGDNTTRTKKRDKSPVNKAWSAFEEMSNKWFGTGK